MTDLPLIFVLFGPVLAFAAGVAVGRLHRKTSEAAVLGGGRPSGAPPHPDLHFAQPVWFPWKGEWKRGTISGPDDPGRRYYKVRSYDIQPYDTRVAHLDLRVDDGEPLTEMCPPMSIVEFEQDMERDQRRKSGGER